MFAFAWRRPSWSPLLALQVSRVEGKHPDDHSGHVQGLAERLLLMIQIYIQQLAAELLQHFVLNCVVLCLVSPPDLAGG